MKCPSAMAMEGFFVSKQCGIITLITLMRMVLDFLGETV